MGARDFRLLFLAVFGFALALDLFLNFLNRRAAAAGPVDPAALPSRLQTHFDAPTLARARAYTLDSLGFASIESLFSAAVTALLLFYLAPLLAAAARILCGPGLTQGVCFLISVTIIPLIAKLPLSVYSTFRIEGRYGFNTMTWGLYWRDFGKEILLGAALGIPLLYALLFFMERAGGAWWLWAFGLILAFQFLLLAVYPNFIAPWFNRFQPLPEGEIKTQLLNLSQRLHFPSAGLFVMDGSRRSTHSNAYFTGIGRWRRIVLFDTLLRQLDAPELMGVMAHEIGHYKLRHVYKLMAAQVLMLGAWLFLASRALAWPPLYAAFDMRESITPAVGLFLFITVFSAAAVLFSPLMHFFSRRHEFAADAFALKATGDPTPLGNALIKLSQKNLSNLNPHPWYSAFHYSHPTLMERLKALKVTI